MDTLKVQNRWRLVLGKYADNQLGTVETSGEFNIQEIDDLMDFLYGREYGEEQDVRQGGKGNSVLSIPKWLNKINELFPKEVIEKMEGHALERYGLTELLTDARVLEKLEPNIALLKQVLSLKSMMQGEVLDVARRIVEQVVAELQNQMQQDIRSAIMGRRDKTRSTPYRCAKNFDFKKTIRKNLKNYDTETGQILVDQVYFHPNIQQYNPWHIIICVDESGSMLEDVIHSAVMAGIFAKLPVLSTKLVIFDTKVVDLSDYVDDPVQTLMSVQLGGGTNIGQALGYCETLIQHPNRTIVVLVSDLCEGVSYPVMYARAKSIIESGARLMCLTSLDSTCTGMYDRTAAKNMATIGASVAALTPKHLANWIGDILGGRG